MIIMKKNICQLLLFATVMVLAACSSDDDITGDPQQPTTETTLITITARYGDGTPTTRVSYSESGNTISATWEAEDQIYVVYDGKVSTLPLVSGTGEATATFSGTISHTHPLTASSVLACYVKDKNNASALTVSDNALVYTADAFTSQDGTLAGAAKCNIYSGTTTYGSGEDLSCSFAVSTAICKFTLKKIRSDYGNEATVTYMSGDNTLASATITVADDDNLVYLAVPAGSYSGEQKVVYDCTATSNLQKYVLSATKANFTAGSTYSKDITFSEVGVFSVSETKTVYFSPGNLQATYDGSSWSWHFATNQWDYIGNNAGNTSVNDYGAPWVSDNNVTVDLFGWSTNSNYYGITSSDLGKDYLGDFKDWGTLAIGSYPADTWRTLTIGEWQYLFSHSTYGMATVNNVHGIIILPDGSALSINTDHNAWVNNTISESDWNSTYEPKRVLFLPAAGYRSYNQVINSEGDYGTYTSSSARDPNNQYNTDMYGIYFGKDYVSSGISGRESGKSVRLVREVK